MATLNVGAEMVAEETSAITTWAVIPAKSPDAAKSRLAPALDPARRTNLAQRLLAGTVVAALACPALAGAVVVSASPELRSIAQRLGAYTCPDPIGVGDAHNAAVQYGCRVAAALGATAALVLSTDLPFLTIGSIADFLDEAGDAPVALAPDRSGTGTNALLLRPPLALAPAFGPGSLRRHRALARERGLAVATVRLPELAFDLDTPDDLTALDQRVRAMLEPSYE